MFEDVQILRLEHFPIVCSNVDGRTYLQDGHRLIEVMPFHRGRGVDRREGRCALHHVSVGFATMIEIMAKASDEQGNALINDENE